MDSDRFDRLARSLSSLLTRRTLAGTVGLATFGLPGLVDAKKRKKHKKKKVKRNEFGCVNVGDLCKNNGQCCSGICKGKKGKKKCKAHDESTCQPGQHEGFCAIDGVNVPCVTSTGDPTGLCDTTTGKAGYCAHDGECFPCAKDADCQPICGPQAACVVCAGCTETGGTGCVGPSEGSCVVDGAP